MAKRRGDRVHNFKIDNIHTHLHTYTFTQPSHRYVFVRTEQEVDPEYQLTPGEEDQFEVPPPLNEGWVDSTKGMTQMVWETGWYPPDYKLSKPQLVEMFKVRPDFLAETS